VNQCASLLDAVFTGFGENTRELEWFVRAGMSPGQALAAATSNGAAMLGMSRDLGAVAPGRYADIVAVEGDPLRGIAAVINGVRWVMKGGAVVVDRTRVASGRIGPGEQSAASVTTDGAIRLKPDATTDQQTIRDVVERFLLHLGDHQVDAVAADLAPKALVIVTRTRAAAGAGAPEWTNSYQTGDEWIAALKRNPSPVTFREPLTNVTVTVDSNQLAYARADFQVIRDNKPVSSGVDQFTLVREASGWKIAVVAYTSIPVSR